MNSVAAAKPLTIAIAGAGLLGRLLAWRLLLQGHAVTLFEATSFSKPRSAAHTAAAMISPFSEVVSTDRVIYDMGMAALQVWPNWIAELNASTAPPVQYAATGSVVVAHPQDASELQQFKQDLAYKLGHDDRSIWWDQRELEHREPQLGHFDEALYLPDEAYLDNRRLLDSLLREISRMQGRCRDSTPVTIDEHRVVYNDGRHEAFDRVIDCRGLGSKINEPGLRGVRGEVMWVETAEVVLKHPVRLMHPRYKLYVVPKPEHRFIIGATEIESEDLSPISLHSTLELASALYTINPALAEARVVETDTNLRPAYIDNRPRITVAEGRIGVNGLYRHGYLLAPVLVDHLCRYLSGCDAGEFWQSLVGPEIDTSSSSQYA